MRLLPLAAVVLVAVCAVAGCATVSPTRTEPSRVPAPPSAGPGTVPLTPPPVKPLLATARAEPRGPSVSAVPPASPVPAPPAARRARAPRHGARTAAPAPPRSRPVGQQAASPPVRAGGGTCALGRTYGHWAAGSSAARICEGVYGR